jgi:flagellar M-ring protein FliF
MAKNLNALLDLPILRPLLLLAGLAVAIAGGITIYMWSHGPDYVMLFADLSERDTMQAAETLRAANTPYRIEAGGKGISVPRAQLDDARLKLAAKGLPNSGGLGAEMLRESQGITSSPSMEIARFQLALETELSRTISALAPIKGARVHLAVPKPTAFTRERRPTSASVFLELHPGRTLEAEQIAAITNLIASSVPDLIAERVTVVDQRGRLLTQPESGEDFAASAQQLDYRNRIEEGLAMRVEELLLPMAGPGRVRAKVNADIDFAVTEEARETYTPDPSKVRSEQTSEQTAKGGLPTGVPGATSNQPAKSGGSQAPAAVQQTLDATTQSRSSTRNFELDKTVSHTRNSAGRVKRLTVAVLVDNLPRTDAQGAVTYQPLTEDERKRVESLVREAVGFDEKRGDSVSVMNAAFQREAPEAPVAALPIWQQPWVLTVARSAGGVIVLLMLIFMVVRPMLKSLLAMPALRGGGNALAAIGTDAQGNAISSGLSATMGALPNPSVATRAYEDKLTAARSAVAQDPKRVAQVVKTWVGADA